MNRTAHRSSAVPRTFGGLFARLRSRLDRRNERGSLLIEAITFMAVIGITLASYTSSNATMNKVQRSQTAIDIVAQQGHGVLEAAKSAPWNRVGFNPATQTGYRAEVDDQYTVVHTQVATSDDDLAPYKELERGGVDIKQRTDITWHRCVAVACSNSVDPGTSGTKKVVVTIEFKVPGEHDWRTETYSLLRSSTPAEVVPVEGVEEVTP